MNIRTTPLVGVLVVGLASIAFAVPAQPPAPQSTATGLSGSFQVNGVNTDLGPVAAVVGKPSGKYDLTDTVASDNQVVALAPGGAAPALYVTASGITSHASASGIQIDSRSSEGDNAMTSATLALNLNPPPPGVGQAAPNPPLTIAITEAVSSADFATVYPANSFASGDAKFGRLVISGALLRGKTLTLSGDIGPNKIVFASPQLTITVNREIKTGVVSCHPSTNCRFNPTKIDVAALDVALHDAPVYSYKVSGEFLINHATAQ
jgi:hypothetical protein